MDNVRSEPIDGLRTQRGVIVDVRSPSEYAKGHWPGAVNLPLFNDQERAEVGTTYKTSGRRDDSTRPLLTGQKLADLAEQPYETGPRGFVLERRDAVRRMAWLAIFSPGPHSISAAAAGTGCLIARPGLRFMVVALGQEKPIFCWLSRRRSVVIGA